MKSNLVPDKVYSSIFAITPADLVGRSHMIIDVDNTLLATFDPDVDSEVLAFFADLRAHQLLTGLCLVSNVGLATPKRLRRIKRIAQQLQAHYVCAYGWYAKPHHRPFKKAMRLLSSTPETTVMVGDQIFTDIRGGNQLGIYTILVSPIGKDSWPTLYRRWLERRLPKRAED